MPTDEEFLSRLVDNPDDEALRSVYVDWLEERGDGRAEFLRAQREVRATEPDDPSRLLLEARLSRARRGLSREWLMRLEPERAHLLASTDAACDCLAPTRRAPLRLHSEPQDTECPAWLKLVEAIERVRATPTEAAGRLRDGSPPRRARAETAEAALKRHVGGRSSRPSGCFAKRPSSRGCTGSSRFHGQPPNCVRR